MTPVIIGDAALYLGDCIEVMRGMEDNSVDSIVTDPPYELGFMGRSWDDSGIAYNVDMWREALRVLKPGGHLLAFSGSRTYHRMTCAIEDAGFEIRDQIMWVYGSGFPKSLDVSKAIDKARDDSHDIEHVRAWLEQQRARSGLTRKAVNEALGLAGNGGGLMSSWTTNRTTACVPQWGQWLQLKALLDFGDEMDAEVWRLNGRKGTPGEAWQSAEVLAVDVRMNEPSGIVGVGQGQRVEVAREIKAANSAAARQWEGWGTALKPAHEPICVARKPLVGTVAANVLQFGTGALNIDGCRVEGRERTDYGLANATRSQRNTYGTPTESADFDSSKGRWPANLIHDGSPEVVALFPAQAGCQDMRQGLERGTRTGMGGVGNPSGSNLPNGRLYGDTGSAARFFYCAKASRADRNEGLEDPGPQFKRGTTLRQVENTDTKGNIHPTVKPTDLMAYLCRLVTPPGGLVLDMFMGSGSTGKAAMREGFQFVGIDMTPEYVEIACARIEHELARIEKASAPAPQMDMFEVPA